MGCLEREPEHARWCTKGTSLSFREGGADWAAKQSEETSCPPAASFSLLEQDDPVLFRILMLLNLCLALLSSSLNVMSP